MSGSVTLTAGELSNITSITLDITGAVGETVDLPIPATDGESIADRDLSSQLTEGGTLTVSMTTTNISVNGYGYGYGYGYFGQTGGGTIAYTLKYTPPSTIGEYRVNLNVFVDNVLVGSPDIKFNVLAPPLLTVLGSSPSSVQHGDAVSLLLAVDPCSFVANATVTIEGQEFEMISVNEIHAAARANIGIPDEACLVVVFRVQTKLGENEVPVTVTETAGNVSTATLTFNVPAQRSEFTVFLNSGINYISTPL